MAVASFTYVRGFQKGYRLAARTAGRTTTHLLLSWLVNLLLVWTFTVLLLWFAVDIFTKNATGGEPVTKVVIGRIKAWNRIYGAPRNLGESAPVPAGGSQVWVSSSRH